MHIPACTNEVGISRKLAGLLAYGRTGDETHLNETLKRYGALAGEADAQLAKSIEMMKLVIPAREGNSDALQAISEWDNPMSVYLLTLCGNISARNALTEIAHDETREMRERANAIEALACLRDNRALELLLSQEFCDSLTRSESGLRYRWLWSAVTRVREPAFDSPDEARAWVKRNNFHLSGISEPIGVKGDRDWSIVNWDRILPCKPSQP